MANTIKIKRGLKANLPTLAVGEQAYCTDTDELFIGTDNGNVLVNPETDLSTYDNHISNTSNPHSVTTTQIGAEPSFTKNTAFNKDFGNTAGTVTQGNDGRLSDARTPLAHTHAISDVTGLQSALNGKTTESYVDTQISNLVDSSPETLDTLNELAAALGNDANFATTVSTNIGTKADKTITISAGTGLTGGGNLSSNRTISHADTSTLSGTYGSTSDGTKIDQITVDANGHVTAITTGATGDIQGVTAGNGLTGGGTSGTVTLNVGAGGGITVAADTVSHADTSSQGSINNSNGTVIQDITLDTYGHITGLGSVNLDSRYLGVSAKAADANLLDGIDSSAFLRSNADDTMSGRLEMGNIIDMNNYDIAGVDQIFHHGDADTYMQFHASDQWRVVTGGSERLEVNNSAVTVSNKLVGKINEVNGNVGINFWTGTQAQYDAIGTKSSTTLYFITE